MIPTTGTTTTPPRGQPARGQGARLRRVANYADGRVLPTERIVEALEALLEPGDRVALEGDNQKQADFLSRALAQVDPTRVHDLHMLISSISRPEQIDIFEKRHRAPDRLRLRRAAEPARGAAARGRLLEVGAIHTYVELYARMFVDLLRASRWSRPKRATGSAISTPAPTPRTRPPSSRRPRSATGS